MLVIKIDDILRLISLDTHTLLTSKHHLNVKTSSSDNNLVIHD